MGFLEPQKHPPENLDFRTRISRLDNFVIRVHAVVLDMDPSFSGMTKGRASQGRIRERFRFSSLDGIVQRSWYDRKKEMNVTIFRICCCVLALGLLSCGDPDTALVDENIGMDPYCEDAEALREALEVSAELTEEGEVSLLFNTGEGLVALSGEATITGALVGFVYYDVTSLWYLLIPEEDEIVIQGILTCTEAEEPFTAVIALSDEGELTVTVSFDEMADAGVADGGE